MELRKTGFTGTESVVYDQEWPHQFNATILSSCAEVTSRSRDITILYASRDSSLVGEVRALLSKAGYCTTLSKIDQIPPANQDVISLLDLTSPFFDNISAKKLAKFQQYIGNLENAGVLWVTRPCQLDGHFPRYSQILGIARTCRSELSIDFATLEMEGMSPAAMSALLEVFNKFHRRRKDFHFEPDQEFSFSGGRIQIPRFHWISVSERLSETLLAERSVKQLNIGKFGLLHSLQWVQQKSSGPLESGQIEVEPRAVGLSFKESRQHANLKVVRANKRLGYSRIYRIG